MAQRRPWWRMAEVALGAGSLGFAAAGSVAPQLATWTLGVTPSWGRVFAGRDLVLGAALIRGVGPAGLVVRAVSDSVDTALAVRRQPLVAVVAAGSAALAAAAAAAAFADRPDRRPVPA